MWHVAVLTQSRVQPPPGQERTQESASVHALAQPPAGQLISHVPTFVHSVLHAPWQFWSHAEASSHSSTQPGRVHVCETEPLSSAEPLAPVPVPVDVGSLAVPDEPVPVELVAVVLPV